MPVITAISPEVIGLVNTELTIGITIQDDYPLVMATQVTWYHQRDLATPLTSAVNSRYALSSDMRSLTINQVTYDDEGNYTIVVSHVTGSQTITIQVNVQGKTPTLPRKTKKNQDLKKWDFLVCTSNIGIEMAKISKGGMSGRDRKETRDL